MSQQNGLSRNSSPSQPASGSPAPLFADRRGADDLRLVDQQRNGNQDYQQRQHLGLVQHPEILVHLDTQEAEEEPPHGVKRPVHHKEHSPWTEPVTEWPDDGHKYKVEQQLIGDRRVRCGLQVAGAVRVSVGEGPGEVRGSGEVFTVDYVADPADGHRNQQGGSGHISQMANAGQGGAVGFAHEPEPAAPGIDEPVRVANLDVGRAADETAQNGPVDCDAAFPNV